MKKDNLSIKVLDGDALNPGDLSWDIFNSLGELTVYSRSNKSEAVERSIDADVIIVNKVNVGKEFIQSCKSLKYVGVTATGFNIIDTECAKANGITVCNVPSYATHSIVQMTFAHILNHACKYVTHVNSVSDGQWVKAEDYCYCLSPLHELKDKTIGVFGFGRSGKAVAEVAKSFGMNILVYHYKDLDIPYEKVSIEQLFTNSDYISLNIPLKADTESIVNKSLISLMKPNSFLVNISRGGLINELDLAEALNSEKIGGAGVDVLSTEPPSEDNPLLTAKNCYITPHIAWITNEARGRLIQQSYDNLKAWVDGNPINVVNL